MADSPAKKKRSDDTGATVVSRPPEFGRSPMADGAASIPSRSSIPPPAWTSAEFMGAAGLARPRSSAPPPEPLAVWPSLEAPPAPASFTPTATAVASNAPEPTTMLPPSEINPSVRRWPTAKPEFSAPRVSQARAPMRTSVPPAPKKDVPQSDFGLTLALGAILMLIAVLVTGLVYGVLTNTLPGAASVQEVRSP